MTRVDLLLVVSILLVGCFNPAGNGDDGASSAATSSAATSAGSTTSGGPTTTIETMSPTTTSGTTCPAGCGETTTTTTGPGTDTGTTTSGATETQTTGTDEALFVAQPKIVMIGAYALAVADFQSDGSADLVIGSETADNPNVGVVFGGTQTINTYPFPPTRDLAIGDIGADADEDIIGLAAGAPGSISAVTWDVNVLVSKPPVAMPIGCSLPFAVAAGQLNAVADQAVDAVVMCADVMGAVFVAEGDVVGTFKPPVKIVTGETTEVLALAGVVGLMTTDLIAIDVSAGHVFVYPGNGELTFDLAAEQMLSVSQALRLATSRLDVDQFVDLAVVSPVSMCPVFLGNDGPVTAGVVADCGPGAYDGQLGDIDGDDVADLVTLHDGEFHVSLNNGDGTFALSWVQATEPTTYRVALGDFDGDLDLDVAVSGMDSVTMYLQTDG